MNLVDSLITVVFSLYQVTVGCGLALHLHFIVIKVPVSSGIILGFSINEGAIPSSPPKLHKKLLEKITKKRSLILREKKIYIQKPKAIFKRVRQKRALMRKGFPRTKYK